MCFMASKITVPPVSQDLVCSDDTYTVALLLDRRNPHIGLSRSDSSFELDFIR
jgi:hypothetical protein